MSADEPGMKEDTTPAAGPPAKVVRGRSLRRALLHKLPVLGYQSLVPGTALEDAVAEDLSSVVEVTAEDILSPLERLAPRREP
jgi:hypothetical protein